jgi:phosphatidylinositol alpha-mannosyltransferase
MKIALVTPYDYPYPGGVTEHIRHLDREFRARGHDTRIIAPSTERQTALDANVIKVTDDVLPVPLNGSTARLTLSPDVPRPSSSRPRCAIRSRRTYRVSIA